MGNAQRALALLLCDDPLNVCVCSAAQKITTTNAAASRLSFPRLPKNRQHRAMGQRALVVFGEGWHEGVKGIVASRLVNTYRVPSLLFTIEDGEARGFRTKRRRHLFKAVEHCKHLHPLRRA